MTGQIAFDLNSFKSEISEVISIIESEKERLEKDVNRFEASLIKGGYKEQVIERWRFSLQERALGLQKLEEFLGQPQALLNGKILAKVYQAIQSNELQNEECVTHIHLTLEKGQITNFFLP